jgi:hypothetical protein
MLLALRTAVSEPLLFSIDGSHIHGWDGGEVVKSKEGVLFEFYQYHPYEESHHNCEVYELVMGLQDIESWRST